MRSLAVAHGRRRGGQGPCALRSAGAFLSVSIGILPQFCPAVCRRFLTVDSHPAVVIFNG
jgi:hypothetical protein